jgi:hypothetical protein
MRQSARSAGTQSASQANGLTFRLYDGKSCGCVAGKDGDNSTIAHQALEKLSTKIEVSYLRYTVKPASTQASESYWVDLEAKLPYTNLK